MSAMSPDQRVDAIPRAAGLLLNKTYEEADFLEPDVDAMARKLRWYARRLFLRGIPFGVNGVIRRRFYIRRFKMWEYARGLAYSRIAPGMRVLDFGGGATLPVFYLAERGCEVMSVDINRQFVDATNALAARRGWKLSANLTNLCEAPAPPEWGTFDRVLSFCVIEHLPRAAQIPTMKKLAGLLRPGGIMVVTFDFGPDAPSEWPLRSREDVDELLRSTGLRPIGNASFLPVERYFPLDKRHPHAKFTMGSLFLTTP